MYQQVKEIKTLKTPTQMKAQVMTIAHKDTNRASKMTKNAGVSYRTLFAECLAKACARLKANAVKALAFLIKHIIAETDKAVLVSVTKSQFKVWFEGVEKKRGEVETTSEAWIPKSQITDGKVSSWFMSKEKIASVN